MRIVSTILIGIAIIILVIIILLGTKSVDAKVIKVGKESRRKSSKRVQLRVEYKDSKGRTHQKTIVRSSNFKKWKVGDIVKIRVWTK